MAQYRSQGTTTRELRETLDKKNVQASRQSKDSVEISISANLTTEAANGIMFDSVTKQIDKALQDLGVNLKVEDGQTGKIDTSAEGTARRIVDFATGFMDAYRQNHVDEEDEVQIRGFISLTSNAIQEGFQQARDYLEGITKLSETIEQNISQTFELTHQYLDEFKLKQLAAFESAEDTVSENPSGDIAYESGSSTGSNGE
jgi:hypothetical protein